MHGERPLFFEAPLHLTPVLVENFEFPNPIKYFQEYNLLTTYNTCT